MRKNLFLLALLTVTAPVLSQKKIIAEIDRMITRPSVEAPLTFLSADEMRGRDTGSPELDIAANYIASEFQKLEIKTLPGADHYFQSFNLERFKKPAIGELKLQDNVFKQNEQFVILEGVNGEWTGEWVYVGYGSAEEIPVDIKGKMVVSIAGSKNTTGREPIYEASAEKLNRIVAGGGVGLIEITPPTVAWSSVVNAFGRQTIVSIKKNRKTAPHLWVKGFDELWFKNLKEQKTIQGSLKILQNDPIQLTSKNVIGKIEGTDPDLKNEYLVISAHYDHLGIGAIKNQDSIYNGARDNALGVVAMLSAARFFHQFPPKRSILFIAFTAEERGLLGSYWYAAHPLVPINQTIFNFNCDGAGYTDKTSAMIIGLGRSSSGGSISRACETFGLTAATDSLLDKVIYEGTDAFNFIKKGVPSICFCPGFKSFNEELLKFYHQPADEVSSLDFEYILKFYKAFVYSNYLIANDPKAPQWPAGDRYELIGKELYNRNR